MSSEKSEKVCHGIGSWVVSTAHSFRRALECKLSEQGVTFRQWEVMAWLNADGEQPQAELADKMGLEAQTLAGIISRMERDGWLSRKIVVKIGVGIDCRHAQSDGNLERHAGLLRRRERAGDAGFERR